MTRAELFNLVWSGPLHRVAARAGMSNVGLRKLCFRLGIPLPPAGYWRTQAQAAALRSRFHAEIVTAAREGLTPRQIRERVAAIGYTGSLRSISRYVARLHPREVWQGRRPPLPPGPEIVARPEGKSFRQRMADIRAAAVPSVQPGKAIPAR